MVRWLMYLFLLIRLLQHGVYVVHIALCHFWTGSCSLQVDSKGVRLLPRWYSLPRCRGRLLGSSPVPRSLEGSWFEVAQRFSTLLSSIFFTYWIFVCVVARLSYCLSHSLSQPSVDCRNQTFSTFCRNLPISARVSTWQGKAAKFELVSSGYAHKVLSYHNSLLNSSMLVSGVQNYIFSTKHRK